MIRDLNDLEGRSIDLRTQVCIVGGGTAGIFLAEQLRSRKIDVAVLEAGGAAAAAPREFGEEPRQFGIRYRGADLGRSFGLGGTSVLWGGQMIPVSPGDVIARPNVGCDAWPVDYGELTEYFASARASLGLGGAGLRWDDELVRSRFPDLLDMSADFALRLSEWLPFRARNMAKGFGAILQRPDTFSIWLNAPVTELKPSAGEDRGRVSSVTAVSSTGNTLRILPDVVVICAGALESTRLLLEFDTTHDQLLTRTGAPLGHYFSDHLSVTCGQFKCLDWIRFNESVAPIFDGPIMRTPRLELSAAAQQRLGATSAFAHFTFITKGETGFDVVRNVLRRRQGERLGFGLSPKMVGRVIHDVSAMAYWRLAKRRLWIPRGAELLLQVDIEQLPNPDSRLFLSGDTDAKGRRRLAIDWRIRDEDARIVRTVAERAAAAWQGSRLAAAAELRLTLPERFDSFETLYDVYHPTGTLRMGTSKDNSVVDRNLRVWPMDNLFVSSTAVFPSAGSANPGLTHLAMTVRLADHLKGRLLN